MPVLADYHEFAGRHWETGTVRNALAYQGITAPHTGQAFSEALLLGISGGITVGYFTFEYTGYPPHLALLTRNTFDPLTTLLERLAIPQEVLQTGKPEKAESNLTEVLDSGRPAQVWADIFSLPYYDLPQDSGMWAMFPILIYGYEAGHAYIADRAKVPIIIPAEDLQKARARVKKDAFRVVMLDAPDPKCLPLAVSQGIWQCIRLYTEAPSKGARHNFGLAALEHWMYLLRNTRNKQSWARYFGPGSRLWMALAGNRGQPGAYEFIQRGEGNSAERGLYADFLDEAVIILNKPGLRQAADQFRQSESAWASLAEKLLPENVPLFQETRDLLDRKRKLFIEQGAAALEEICAINLRLNAIAQRVAQEFPLDETAVVAYREELADQVSAILDCERQAVATLQVAML